MHTGARLYKIPLLENKATCTVMNLIKLTLGNDFGVSVEEALAGYDKQDLPTGSGDPSFITLFSEHRSPLIEVSILPEISITKLIMVIDAKFTRSGVTSASETLYSCMNTCASERVGNTYHREAHIRVWGTDITAGEHISLGRG